MSIEHKLNEIKDILIKISNLRTVKPFYGTTINVSLIKQCASIEDALYIGEAIGNWNASEEARKALSILNGIKI